MKTILVPFDGSKAAESALDVAVDLALQHGAGIRLLHVLLHESEADELLDLPGVSDAGAELTEALARLAETPEQAHALEEDMAHPCAPLRPAPDGELRRIGGHVLDWAKRRAAERRADVQVLDLADGAPAEAILAAADSIAADAIVMGTRGLRPIDAFTIGSVSQKVCNTAKCTCIMVH